MQEYRVECHPLNTGTMGLPNFNTWIWEVTPPTVAGYMAGASRCRASPFPDCVGSSLDHLHPWPWRWATSDPCPPGRGRDTLLILYVVNDTRLSPFLVCPLRFYALTGGSVVPGDLRKGGPGIFLPAVSMSSFVCCIIKPFLLLIFFFLNPEVRVLLVSSFLIFCLK